MKVFSWVRQQFANAIYEGWREGILLIEHDIDISPTTDRDSRVQALPEQLQADDVAVGPLTGHQVAPLRGMVDRLRLSSGEPKSGQAKATADTTTRKRGPRKREDNDQFG